MDSLLKWKDKKYRPRFASLFAFLFIMCAAFYLCAAGGAPNLPAFLAVVVACWLFIVIFLVRRPLAGLVMMVAGGMFGYFCDLWGVSSGLWAYNTNTVSMLVLNGGDLARGGFPIEIVLSYVFAAMWFTYILESLFDVETNDMASAYEAGAAPVKIKSFIPVAVIASFSALVIAIEPLHLEALGYFTAGVFLMSFIPGRMKSVPLVFGIVTGIAGTFFELFCTGHVVPGALIWTYQQPVWDALRIPSPMFSGVPISALYAYFGVGAALSSIYLLLLRWQVFRK